jgi:hypothetical protein
MRDVNHKTKLTILILSILVIVMGSIMLYKFVVQPGINNYSYEKQLEGANFVFQDIVTGIQNNGYYAIPLGSNQTLILVAYNPQQAQIPTQ